MAERGGPTVNMRGGGKAQAQAGVASGNRFEMLEMIDAQGEASPKKHESVAPSGKQSKQAHENNTKGM